jgi:cell division septum initiation protein DivIVA
MVGGGSSEYRAVTKKVLDLAEQVEGLYQEVGEMASRLASLERERQRAERAAAKARAAQAEADGQSVQACAVADEEMGDTPAQANEAASPVASPARTPNHAEAGHDARQVPGQSKPKARVRQRR